MSPVWIAFAVGACIGLLVGVVAMAIACSVRQEHIAIAAKMEGRAEGRREYQHYRALRITDTKRADRRGDTPEIAKPPAAHT